MKLQRHPGPSSSHQQSTSLPSYNLPALHSRPPELIIDGLLTKAGDVYAFGVVLWELYMGTRAWEGLKTSEVLNHVASKRSLVFPPSTPHRLKVVWCIGRRKGGWVPVQSVQMFGAQLHLQISAGEPDHAHQ